VSSVATGDASDVETGDDAPSYANKPSARHHASTHKRQTRLQHQHERATPQAARQKMSAVENASQPDHREQVCRHMPQTKATEPWYTQRRWRSPRVSSATPEAGENPLASPSTQARRNSAPMSLSCQQRQTSTAAVRVVRMVPLQEEYVRYMARYDMRRRDGSRLENMKVPPCLFVPERFFPFENGFRTEPPQPAAGQAASRRCPG